MNVLFLNHAQAIQANGGDMVHLRETQYALESLGLKTQLASRVQGVLDGIDIVHLFNLTLSDLTPHMEALSKAKAAGIPVVVSTIYYPLHEPEYASASRLRPKWRTINRLLGHHIGLSLWKLNRRRSQPYKTNRQHQVALLHQAARLFTASKTEIRWIESDFPEIIHLHHKARVIPAAINPEIFDPVNADPERIKNEYGLRSFALQVSRFTPIKNQHSVLRALRDWPGTLVFIGDRGYPSYFDACQVAARKRRGKTLFLPRLPSKDLRDFYAAAQAHVLASWRESTGLVALEAGAMGCRLVVSNRLPANEIYGQHAFVCDPLSPSSIRNAVLTAMSVPKSPDYQTFVRKEFTWPLAAQKLLNEYTTLLSNV